MLRPFSTAPSPSPGPRFTRTHNDFELHRLAVDVVRHDGALRPDLPAGRAALHGTFHLWGQQQRVWGQQLRVCGAAVACVGQQ